MLGVAWEVTEEVTEDGYVAPRLVDERVGRSAELAEGLVALPLLSAGQLLGEFILCGESKPKPFFGRSGIAFRPAPRGTPTIIVLFDQSPPAISAMAGL